MPSRPFARSPATPPQRAHIPLRARLDVLGALASFAFPVLYCRSARLTPDQPMAYLWDRYEARVRLHLGRRPFWLRPLLLALWPPAVVLTALVLTAVNGLYTARRHGRGVARQFADQLRLAFAHGVPPQVYYLYELHDPARAAHGQEFLYRSFVKSGGFYRALYASDRPRELRAKIVNDKLAFHDLLRDHGLPTARIHGVVTRAGIDWRSEPARLPERDLFIKPRTGKGGRGAEKWLWSDGRYAALDGRRLEAGALAAHLAAETAAGSRLIQDALTNHAALSGLTAGALSTLRMYTFWDETGGIEHIFTMLRMSRDPASAVDNIHRGGIAAAVDAATGRLGPATDAGVLARLGWLDRHPVTGARITGLELPFWPETMDLARALHRLLPEACLIGWDIAITDAGPVLIEGNKAPDIEIEQRLDGPWGNARFGALLAHHLRQRYTGEELR